MLPVSSAPEGDVAALHAALGDLIADAPALVEGTPSVALETRKVRLQTHPFFAGQLRIVFHEEGTIDFCELGEAARRALGASSASSWPTCRLSRSNNANLFFG